MPGARRRPQVTSSEVSLPEQRRACESFPEQCVIFRLDPIRSTVRGLHSTTPARHVRGFASCTNQCGLTAPTRVRWAY
jgi:hypothetical protein